MNDRQSSHHLHELYIPGSQRIHTYQIKGVGSGDAIVVIYLSFLQKMVSFFLFAMMSPGFTFNLGVLGSTDKILVPVTLDV